MSVTDKQVSSNECVTTDPEGRARDRGRLPLRGGERRMLLVAVDLLMVNGGLLIYLLLRPDPEGLGFLPDQELGWELLLQRPLWFLILSVVWFPAASAFDVYRQRVSGRLGPSVAAVLRAGTMAILVYLLIPYLTPTLPPSRRYLGLFAGPTLALLALGRSLWAMTLSQPYFRRPTLIVGAGWAGRAVAQTVLQHGDGSFAIIGFVDDDPAKLGAEVPALGTDDEFAELMPAKPSTFRVLGDHRTLKMLNRKHHVRTLILAKTGNLRPELLKELMDCLEAGVEIVSMTSLHEQLTGRVPVEHVKGHWQIAMPTEHPGTATLWPIAKRGMDIVLASIGLVLLGLALPIIALAICLDGRGPIFYTQTRLGKGGKPFRVFKFRSMRPSAEEDTAVWAKRNDPRVTRVGRLLRLSHVDEFPQFLNVLKGEMSAVGPRPERPEFLDELVDDIPFYTVRHAVKPGMAGWALVNHGYGSSKRDALLKLQYDLYYIKHQGPWLDAVILLKAFVHSFGMRGR